MIKEFASFIDFNTIDKAERKQITTFWWIVSGEYIRWCAPTIKCKAKMKEGALHLRAYGGTGHETAMEYKRAYNLARRMSVEFSQKLIDDIPEHIKDQAMEDKAWNDYPREIRQSYDHMVSKENAIFDREYEYRIYDYIDRINGIDLEELNNEPIY